MISPEHGTWAETVVSVPPEAGPLPVAFVRRALDEAQRRLEV
ncbi:hypothetical protein ACFVYP_17180 [Kitasatospora sp. NPDC058201]|nr:hypothetical protein [Streptomyces sp. BE303]MED7955315.1 hypothetical protein [Streptomyces sp. BE303]